LLTGKSRAGTVVTVTDCYFAIIHRDSYEKLILKDEKHKMLTNVRFLRTIPYISNWFNREIQSLYMLRKERKIEFSGKTIINEGDPCDKVIIVLKGEVEIVKTNLSTIFFNQATRTLGMKEYREKGMMVQSEFVFDPNEEGVAAQLGVISSQA